MINSARLQFAKLNGIVPAIIQDAETRNVLMLGFMNQEALQKTIAEKRVTFFSRTKQRLWTKGETSGNYLEVVEIRSDCDDDSLLIRVKPKGAACHTGSDTCFNETNKAQGPGFLEAIIRDRRKSPKEGSYTNSLFEAGINRIAQKVGEEAVELVIEAKDDNNERFLDEAADLMYHYLVLLVAKGVTLDEVTNILEQRHFPK